MMDNGKLSRRTNASAALLTAEFLIALLPVYFWALYAFGMTQVHLVLGVSLASSVLLTMCMQFAVLHRLDYRKLLTATVNGFLLGFLMPADVPMWVVVIGAFITSVPYYIPYVGRYFTRYVHPIALAVTFLTACFAVMQATNDSLLLAPSAPMTPLSSLLDGFIPEEGIYDLLLGRHSGLMGEISVLMILAGGVYLAFRKIIHLESGIFMLATLAALSYAFPVTGERLDFLVAQMFTGGVFFVAVFLTSYYGTMPVTRGGRVLYGVLCGALTYVFRRYFPQFDGVFAALLIASALVAILEPLTAPRVVKWKTEF